MGEAFLRLGSRALAMNTPAVTGEGANVAFRTSLWPRRRGRGAPCRPGAFRNLFHGNASPIGSVAHV
jgi:hypothetical protein